MSKNRLLQQIYTDNALNNKKRCYICKQFLDYSCFNKDKYTKSGLNSRCKDCDKIHKQKYYYKTRERNKQTKFVLQQKINNYKSKIGCKFCGQKESRCLDLHHMDKIKKYDTVSNMICNRKSLNDILIEVEKCEVICGNCHRKFHKNNKEISLRLKTRQWFREYKSQFKCEKCGEKDTTCLDFHHIKDKIHDIAICVGKNWPKEKVLEEISKCKVLCVNCHRMEHIT